MDEKITANHQKGTQNSSPDSLISKVIVNLPAQDQPTEASEKDSDATKKESEPTKRTLREIVVEQGFMIALTAVIAISTSMYTYYARKQWRAMEDQWSAMQNQTGIMQQQLTQMQLQLPELQKSAKAAEDSANLTKHSVVGTEAAMVGGGIASDQDRGLIFSFYNSGKSIATNITGAVRVTRKNLNTGKIIGTPKTIAINMSQLRGQDSHGNFGYDVLVLDPSFRDITQISQLKETVIVDGAITFNDGFNNIIPIKICEQLLANINSQGDYVGYAPVQCAGADSWMSNLKWNAAKAKASQPKQ
jgi:hypothetical protein